MIEQATLTAIVNLVLGLFFILFTYTSVISVISVFTANRNNMQKSDWFHRYLYWWGHMVIASSLLIVTLILLYGTGMGLKTLMGLY